VKNNRVVRPKTYDRPGYRSQERKHRALARAADTSVLEALALEGAEADALGFRPIDPRKWEAAKRIMARAG
jgi:hypothetical protein